MESYGQLPAVSWAFTFFKIDFICETKFKPIAIPISITHQPGSWGERRPILSKAVPVEIFVDAPLVVCEERDAKGWYQKARAGQLLQCCSPSKAISP